MTRAYQGRVVFPGVERENGMIRDLFTYRGRWAVNDPPGEEPRTVNGPDRPKGWVYAALEVLGVGGRDAR